MYNLKIIISCDIVIYNKNYIFGLHPHSWQRAPKNYWNFLCEKSIKGILYYVNEVNFRKLIKMVAGCLENQPCNLRARPFSPTLAPILHLQRSGEELEIEFAKGQLFNQSYLSDEAAIKI